MADSQSPRERVAQVDEAGRIPDASGGERIQVDAAVGSIVRVSGEPGSPQVLEVLAGPGTALAESYRLALEHGLDPLHPPAVVAETNERTNEPGFDDPALADLRALPFVTIDGPGTRDLDQALWVGTHNGGHLVRYALADASHFVRPGDALFEEGLARGASYYLPGLSIPMLPRKLSEDLVSLEPGVDRRATVFEMHLDERGRCTKTEVTRALIHSRHQLTFERVQSFLDDPSGRSFGEPDLDASLQALRTVGELRLDYAAERDVAFYRRTEVAVKLADRDDLEFSVVNDVRNSVELYSEQLSLMCNVEGARLLRDGDTPDDEVHPIYRVHNPPQPQRVASLERLLVRLAEVHGLDRDTWTWNRRDQRSLSRFLASLPTSGPHVRVAQAIQRQAIMINMRSVFSPDPGRHHGVGADVYARFSAPMREIVGVFLHKELWEKLGQSPPAAGDEQLRTQIVQRANEAKLLQRELTRAANLLVLDQLFGGDVAKAPEERKPRTGTVMGITRTKLHVRLDDPAIDIKVYARHVPGGWQTDEEGTWARRGEKLFELGSAVQIAVRERDAQGRWKLDFDQAG